jgi:1-acylglycerone phosphate reductase
MAASPRIVLVTGCSDGSLGSALALALDAYGGVRVLAAARDINSMSALTSAGIEVFSLDVTCPRSIASLVKDVSTATNSRLHMLINSVGRGHYEPFLHLDLDAAKALFDVNVWGYVGVTQAFLPLLLSSASGGGKSTIVNNTSISSELRTPFHSAYSASKAAMAAFNDIQRIELAPLGINVVDLKTGSLSSNFAKNKSNTYELPADSPYQPIRDDVVRVISGEATEAYAEDRHVWARNVVGDLLKKADAPPARIWRGGAAGTVQVSSKLDGMLPAGVGDRSFEGLGGLEKLAGLLAEQRGGE